MAHSSDSLASSVGGFCAGRGRGSYGSGSARRSSGLRVLSSALLGCLLVASASFTASADDAPQDSPSPIASTSTPQGPELPSPSPHPTVTIPPSVEDLDPALKNRVTETVERVNARILELEAREAEARAQLEGLEETPAELEALEETPAELEALEETPAPVALSQDWEDFRSFVIVALLIGVTLSGITAVGSWRR